MIDNREKIVIELMKQMPPGVEVTLAQFNEKAKYDRIYDLYEIVQKHLRINYVMFTFVKLHPLENSSIIRKF